MQFTLPNIREVSFPMDRGKTTLTITKEWNDGENPYKPSSAQFQLMYKSNDSTEYLNYNEPITITGPSWQYTWSGMPKNGYSYKVVEVNTADGYEVSYENDGILKYDDGAYSAKIKNTLVDKTKVLVAKEWDDNDNSAESRPENINFQLMCRYKGDREWSPYPGNGAIITLDGKVDNIEKKAWYGEFESLPRMHGDALLEYTVRKMDGTTVVEDGMRWNSVGDWSYEVSYTEDKQGYLSAQTNIANNIVIKNTLICSELKITKRIDSLDLSRGNATFWFLVTGDDGYNSEVKISFGEGDENLVGLDKAGKSIIVTALAAGDYKVMELPSKGYALVEAGLDGTIVPEIDGKIKLDADAQVTITNEIQPVSLSITKRIGNYNEDVERSVFWYEVKGPNGYKEQVKVSFTAEETDLLGYDKDGKSVTITDLYPGDYTVRELPVVGYDLVQAALTDTAAPSEDAEKISFATELEDTVLSGETGTYYFWNNFKEITQRYSIKNVNRFDENGDIVLSNSRDVQ